MPRTVIRSVRPWGGAPADVVLDDGLVSEVVPAGTAAVGAAEIAGDDGILVPSFSDVHVHLDSTRLGLPFRPLSAGPTRWDRIMNDRAHWRTAEAPVADRATETLRRMIALGATRVRSHAQVDADSKLEKFEGVLAAREAHSASASVEIVVFPQVGIHLEPGVPELMDEALRAGGDLVGGIDPCEIDRDPRRHLDTVFELAERHQKGVDIHLHEPGELGLFSMSLVTERVRALGMQGRVTVSHAFALGSGLAGVERTVDELAELDVAVTTIAPGGRLELPLERMVTAGVRVGLGMDGQRDYWSPWGNADMLERAWLLAHSQGWSRDDLIELGLAVATWGGASVIDGRTPRLTGVGHHPGITVGDPAELVILRGETPTSAVMDRLPGRTVIHAGRVVAADGELV
ncbi:amidohydrolase family protein [Promicromonospora sp. MEB111]|uniref:amidohydrolase family protein n=1 Tax=Promicromonospora sp. MEB111 TaxID=3040301 RepID=UPI00254E5AC6|nr:amidohydrolase family protein [Promicromonospora sp. MEB111]